MRNPRQPRDPAEVIEIRDPAIDVDKLMAEIRANVARRLAEGAYREDVDAITQEVFAEVKAAGQAARTDAPAASGSPLPLAELNAQWMIREQPFISKAPVIGRLIVLIRNAWNWMSTKWYVRPLIQQISNFNFTVVRAFHDVDMEQRVQAARVAEMDTLIRQQAAEIEALRLELAALREPGQRG